jgi:hypothetical protein
MEKSPTHNTSLESSARQTVKAWVEEACDRGLSPERIARTCGIDLPVFSRIRDPHEHVLPSLLQIRQLAHVTGYPIHAAMFDALMVLADQPHTPFGHMQSPHKNQTVELTSPGKLAKWLHDARWALGGHPPPLTDITAEAPTERQIKAIAFLCDVAVPVVRFRPLNRPKPHTNEAPGSRH